MAIIFDDDTINMITQTTPTCSESASRSPTTVTQPRAESGTMSAGGDNSHRTAESGSLPISVDTRVVGMVVLVIVQGIAMVLMEWYNVVLWYNHGVLLSCGSGYHGVMEMVNMIVVIILLYGHLGVAVRILLLWLLWCYSSGCYGGLLDVDITAVAITMFSVKWFDIWVFLP